MKQAPRILANERVLVAVMAVAALYVSWRYGTMVAGGSDSFGYISQADSWVRGSVEIPQPWIRQVPWPNAGRSFSPLGYLPSQDQRGIVPTYPPGLPLLMAGAARLGGYCAMFWVVPISAALMVVGTFFLGRRLDGGRTGTIAAALVASSPVFLYMSVNPMTDVPVASAWTMSFVLLLGPPTLTARFARSFGAGLVAGLAVLIRPNLAPVAAVPLAWFALKAWRAAPPERVRHVWRGLWFVAGLVPGVVVLAVFNWKMYGSPWRSGYGDVSYLFSSSHLLPNLVNYTRWFAEKHAYLPLLGLYALVMPGRWPWRAMADPVSVRVMGLFVVVVWLQYCFYTVFDAWWYLRFLLPCWPFIMIGFAAAASRIAERSRAAAAIVAIAIVALGVRGVWDSVQENSFVLWGSERGYVKIAELVRSVTGENSVILASQHSGSLRYYGGRLTINYGALNAEWLDRALDWLEDRGVHPYVLLDDYEVAAFKGKFQDQRKVALLDALPVLTYQTAGLMSLYDLSRVPRTHPTLAIREFPHKGSHCTPPAAPPRLVLQ
jgi:Dolichyl-phosphate-mannose-protein mannosyltransferase